MKAFALIEILLSLSLLAIGIAGTINGYVLSSYRVLFLTCSQAANNSAIQRMEQVRSAMWDVQAWPPIDEVLSTNFPNQSVVLDLPISGTNAILATNYTEIVKISECLKFVKIDCVWETPNKKLFTNSIETYICPR